MSQAPCVLVQVASVGFCLTPFVASNLQSRNVPSLPIFSCRIEATLGSCHSCWIPLDLAQSLSRLALDTSRKICQQGSMATFQEGRKETVMKCPKLGKLSGSLFVHRIQFQCKLFLPTPHAFQFISPVVQHEKLEVWTIHSYFIGLCLSLLHLEHRESGSMSEAPRVSASGICKLFFDSLCPQKSSIQECPSSGTLQDDTMLGSCSS